MTATCFAQETVEPEIVIATFGEATLIQRPGSGCALTGGSFDERIEAKEWISLFMHEALIREKLEDSGGLS